MKTFLNILSFSVTGIGIGCVITTLSMALLGAEGCSIKELAVWIAASAIMGAVTLIMFSNRLKFSAAAAIHCTVCFAAVTAAVFICGYTDNFLTFIKTAVPMFILIYAAIFLAIYLCAKANEKAVNKALREKRKKS